MNMGEVIYDKEQSEQNDNENVFSEPFIFKINNNEIVNYSNIVFLNANKHYFKSNYLKQTDGKDTKVFVDYFQGNDFHSFINSLQATSHQIGKIKIICNEKRTLLSPMIVAYFDLMGNRIEKVITKEMSSYQKMSDEVEILLDFKLDNFTEIVFTYIKSNTSMALYLYPYAINDLNEFDREFDEPEITGLIIE